MNILALNWRDITHPNAGGAELNVHETLKRLIKKGHKATLFSGYYNKAKPKEVIDGINIFRKGNIMSVYFWAFIYYILYFRKQNFDVIIESILGTPWFSLLYSRKPRVILIHHVEKEIFFIDVKNFVKIPIIASVIAIIAYSIESYIMPLFYKNLKIIAVSKSTKEELIDLGIRRENISIIYNGISNNLKPDYKLKTKYPSIIYLGRLVDYKRIDILIELINEIRIKMKDIKLHIAGSGEIELKLKRLVKESSLEKHIIFHGFVNEKEKLKLLQQSWLFISTSVKEGWGISILEANACDTPSIVFDVPGLNEAVMNNKTGFVVKDQDELLKKSIYILRNNRLRSKMSKEAYKWSKKFNWNKTSEDTLKLLNQVIK